MTHRQRRLMRKQLTIHHLVTKSHGGNNNPFNLSYVPEDRHRWWHCLFRDWTIEQIVEEINKHWIPRNYYLRIERRTQ